MYLLFNIKYQIIYTSHRIILTACEVDTTVLNRYLLGWAEDSEVMGKFPKVWWLSTKEVDSGSVLSQPQIWTFLPFSIEWWANFFNSMGPVSPWTILPS